MPQNSFPRWLLAVLTLAVLAVAASGFWFYRAQEQLLRQKAETHLQAIVQLKADQIADWRGRLLTDAAERMESPFADEALRHWLVAPLDGDTAQLLDSFRSLQKYHQYRDVLLVDAAGQTRLSLSGRLDPLPAEMMTALVAAWRDHRPTLTDLHAGPGDLPVHIEAVAPLYTDNGAPAGAIILQSDAQQFLYPLVQSWPIPNQSAETLLVRRDGDAVLYLNDLRRQADTALKLRIPLSQTNVPAVMAVLGQTGVVQGYGYHGVEVLSVLQPVPDSPWYIIAQVDAAEALAVWQTRSMLVVALILGFVAAIAAVTGVVWQRNQKVHYRALFQAEAARRASEERYRVTLMSVGDGIIAADAAGRVDLLNPAAEALTGWRQEEAQGRPLEEVFCIVNEETRQPVENPAAAVMRQGMVVGLANHTLLLARDGAERPIADSGAPIRGENGQISGVVLVFRDQTQERAAQKALQESEARYRELFENINSGVAVYEVKDDGRDFIFKDFNRAGEKIDHDQRERLIGKSIFDMRPGVERFGLIEVLRQVWQTGQPAHHPITIYQDEHLTAWYENSVYKLPSGELVAVFEDVTERKQAEEKLNRTLERLNLATRAAHLGIWDWDIQKNELVWDDRMYELYGVKKEDFGGAYEAWLAGIHPDDRAASDEISLQAQRGEREYDTEFRALWPDGSVRVLKAYGRVMRDAEGKPLRMTGVNYDITAQRQAEETLRQSEEKFRRLVELSVDGIVLIDEQGRIMEWNQGQEQITGLKRAEVVGRPLWEVQFNLALPERKTPAAPEQIKVNIKDFLRTGDAPWQNQLVESEFQTPDGTRRFMQSIIFPIRTAKGVMAASIARDITARKQAEEQIKASLREKEVMLQEIHHRVKNNLQVICSLLDMQADAVQDPRVLQALQDSQQRVRSMALVHEKLYQAEDLTRVDFADYIQEMTAYLLMVYSDLARPITPRLEVEQVFLGVDKAIPCGLIVNELVSNALKYAFPPPPSSPPLGGIEGGDFLPPEIRVSFARSDGEYTLIVGDNGMGLPASVDVDNLPSLGLRLVKILTDQLQGALEIERNHGTTFKLTFPENHQKSRPRF